MPGDSSGGPSGEAIAHTRRGSAGFQRVGPKTVKIDLKYRIGGLKVEGSSVSLEERVAALCEKEIQIVRQEMMQLGLALASQLSDGGRDVNLRRKWHDDDERTWRDERSAFYVRPSSYESSESISVPADAADAAIVRTVIEGTIAQREQSIRNMYSRILTDAQAERHHGPNATRQPKTD